MFLTTTMFLTTKMFVQWTKGQVQYNVTQFLERSSNNGVDNGVVHEHFGMVERKSWSGGKNKMLQAE